MPDNDIIIVGAGAAGLMAATVAAEHGLRVLLLEKMDQPGRKLRITGKGRCNLTNTASLKETLPHIGSDSRFLRNCYARFFNRELMTFFEQRGVALVEERGGRIFPASGRALDIFLALVTELENSPYVTIRKNSMVKSLLMATPLHADDKPRIRGVRLQNGENLSASHVIVATGGLSYPTTGSTGAGLLWAEECGHHVTTPVPSLVPLVCSDPLPSELTGFALRNVSLSITQTNGHKLCEFFGEMSFTEDGIGGPIVLSASRMISRRLHEGESLIAHIDLKPAIESGELDQRLIHDFDNNGRRLFHDALRLWLPAEMVPLALQRLHIEYYKRLHQINGEERKRLRNFLKDCSLTITGTRSFNEAIITQGGVSLKEVNPQTLESRLVNGLYWIGEVLDLDADTGGYNLQIAFSTAHAAANAIAMR